MVKKKNLFHSFLCGGAHTIDTYTSMYLHTHPVLYTLWVECKHTYLCMYVQTQPHTQLRLVRGKKCVFLFCCFFSWRSVLDGYLLRLFSLALAFCLSVWHPQLWQSRNTRISVQQESMGKLFAFQICSRVWRVMWHSASIEIRDSRRWDHTADMQGDEGETLTVRLSRSSCMIKVLSL